MEPGFGIGSADLFDFYAPALSTKPYSSRGAEMCTLLGTGMQSSHIFCRRSLAAFGQPPLCALDLVTIHAVSNNTFVIISEVTEMAPVLRLGKGSALEGLRAAMTTGTASRLSRYLLWTSDAWNQIPRLGKGRAKWQPGLGGSPEMEP